MRPIVHDERASFTLEASLVLPVVFLLIVALMFLALYLYESVMVGQAAAVAAERAAFSWSSSYREPQTGASREGVYDSLYWRLTGDDLLQAVFGWSAGHQPSEINLPVLSAGQGEDEELTLKKLRNTGAELPSFLTGRMVYSHGIADRYIEVKLQRKNSGLATADWFGQNTATGGQSAAAVVEPAEWIRTVELAGYFTAKFRGGGDEGAGRTAAAEALKQFGKP